VGTLFLRWKLSCLKVQLAIRANMYSNGFLDFYVFIFRDGSFDQQQAVPAVR